MVGIGGAVTFTLPILLISMMVAGSVLLCVVVAGVAVLAVVLHHEQRKLQHLAGYAEQLKRLSADVAVLRKNHLALDELVSQWMSRSAVRAKRAKKEKAGEEEEGLGDLPDDVLFPTLIGRSDG